MHCCKLLQLSALYKTGQNDPVVCCADPADLVHIFLTVAAAACNDQLFLSIQLTVRIN